ncbi:small GTP-binding protein, putative [Trichomonas vaginalis G3]|uniref:Small GTP-binding protein, putative n=1 Tax=Trichomonas vaginalis (strain ATCC PRA-98 / G3) TaxID=412133 RepID=A2F5E2_TRIV3|nr:small Rab GTPase RabC2 [Trichomonas vaginalis G3]EAX99855.1 small GTP-binding protein, putative [Trichomonas vaginalis G3]KAI5549606.1 small Rab GTPase RabC2 [Trichomonas vaginalis G3]|eukprot:XP_001312785.1 small GTP-binding protein [Trichomonas vaginalis G3]
MKIVLVGDTQVGKTCVLARLINKEFKSDSQATIGAAFQNYFLQTPAGFVQLQIWDTAGQEQSRSLAPMYYRAASVAILFYDVTNLKSFQALKDWMDELQEKAPVQLQIVIVGNKCDLEDRVVSTTTAQQFAKQNGAAFYCETSAKTGEGS